MISSYFCKIEVTDLVFSRTVGDAEGLVFVLGSAEEPAWVGHGFKMVGAPLLNVFEREGPALSIVQLLDVLNLRKRREGKCVVNQEAQAQHTRQL